MSYDTDKLTRLLALKNFAQRANSRISAIESNMQTITPKNAYDIAKDEGYTGTQAQWIESLSAYGVAVKNGYTGTVEEWLESLKAAGEWSELNARTSILTSTAAEVHNSIAGFRDKGTELTDEQKTAIKNHTWEDMYIGDSWTLNGHTYRIALFRERSTFYKTSGIMMLSDVLYRAPMNETDTNEGGYLNSWMYAEGLAQAEDILAADFGDLLTTFNEHLSASTATGYTASQNMTLTCMIPTYHMLFGHAYEGYPQNWFKIINHQLPLTLYEAGKMQLYSQYYFWCQECLNSTNSFINFQDYGVAAWAQAQSRASVQNGVRVIFFIG